MLNGTFSVGMLVAYLSYQMRFSPSISSLTDKFFSWRMLDVYNERLADIVLTPTEDHQKHTVQEDRSKSVSPSAFRWSTADDIHPPLSLEHIIFIHKCGNKPILRVVSLTLHPGKLWSLPVNQGAENRRW